ncbi:hypothetical protein [Stenotrophomonas sp. PS02289]|uniref:hypothetical protein n=1 Tax=Stenotrophomonas sp. PS02289 TaxID=2991422 RepID=UPI00249B19D1|nr:hypothetical protein [Stenotrophomonas sp. PS02289]
MNDTSDTPPMSRRRLLIRQWGAILWPSFVAAGLASMVFFAFVDPLRLRDITFPQHAVSREMGYTLGFFMFWAVTAAASAVTWYLLRPLRRDDDDVPLG